jgi:hypothetical protein
VSARLPDDRGDRAPHAGSAIGEADNAQSAVTVPGCKAANSQAGFRQ